MERKIFSPSYVFARWAYSEITEGALKDGYDGVPGIEELRRKRGERVPLKSLSSEDHFALAEACVTARPMLLGPAAGLDGFEKRTITKVQLAAALVAPTVAWVELQGQFAPFEIFMNLPPPASQKDARNVKENPNGYLPPEDPITFGRLGGSLVLLDGYHRAAAFWKFAPASATLEAFVPPPFPGSQLR